jgi:hypothetical protein
MLTTILGFFIVDNRLDAYGLLMAYKNKACSLGVAYVADEVTALTREGARVTGSRLASGGALRAGITVNCAGP